jgi:hypothetical protein
VDKDLSPVSCTALHGLAISWQFCYDSYCFDRDGNWYSTLAREPDAPQDDDSLPGWLRELPVEKEGRTGD